MARTATVTKGAVTKNNDGSYSVSLKMVYAEDALELFSKEYSTRYVTGENTTVLGNQIRKDMQDDIDDYKAAQILLNSATLTNIVSAIQTGLVV